MPAALCRELQYAVIRVCHSAFVEDGITLSPDHILGRLISHNFHCSGQHYTGIFDQAFVIEIYARIRVVKVLLYTH